MKNLEISRENADEKKKTKEEIKRELNESIVNGERHEIEERARTVKKLKM